MRTIKYIVCICGDCAIQPRYEDIADGLLLEEGLGKLRRAGLALLTLKPRQRQIHGKNTFLPTFTDLARWPACASISNWSKRHRLSRPFVCAMATRP